MRRLYGLIATLTAALALTACGGDDEERGATRRATVAPQPPTTATTAVTLPKRIEDATRARDAVLRAVTRPDRAAIERLGLDVVPAASVPDPGELSLEGSEARWWFVVTDVEGHCEGGVVQRGVGRPYKTVGKACSARAAPPR